MKAVSNTTPLRYLIAIEQEHLLGKLFEKVFVPLAVHEELTDARTPEMYNFLQDTASQSFLNGPTGWDS